MKKLIALLLVLVMAIGLVACGTDPNPPATNPSSPANPSNPASNDPTEPQPTEPNPTEPQPTEPAPTEPATLEYVWDVTVVFAHYDAKGGEVPPVLTITEVANAEHTLELNAIAALGALAGDVVDFTPLLNETNDVVLDGELKASSPVFNEADWIISDNNRGSIISCEVVTPLTEGDSETHGELLIIAEAPDYIWEVTVIFGEGTEGTYEFTNPGLSDWDEKYIAQVFTVTPENNTFELPVFNHSSWIVDNTPSWYKWGVYDVDDVAPYITFTIVERLNAGDRLTHGKLTITLSITQ